MAKQKFEKELKLKISRRMDRDLTLVAEQAGLYSADVVRNAIRTEISRLKKTLRQTFLRPEDWASVRDIAAERGVTVEVVLSEFIALGVMRQRRTQFTK